jgi:hypothetical protein
LIGGLDEEYCPLRAIVTLECTFPQSTLEPPLSRAVQDEVAATKPLSIDTSFIELYALDDSGDKSLSFSSRYESLKALNLLVTADVTNKEAEGPRKERLEQRFRGSVLVLEVLGKMGAEGVRLSLPPPRRPHRLHRPPDREAGRGAAPMPPPGALLTLPVLRALVLPPRRARVTDHSPGDD